MVNKIKCDVTLTDKQFTNPATQEVISYVEVVAQIGNAPIRMKVDKSCKNLLEYVRKDLPKVEER